MKNFTFKTNNNTTNSFRKSTDYTKILDALIADNLKKNNTYLNDYAIEHDLGIAFKPKSSSIIGSSTLKVDNEFIKAATFLANYKKNTKKFIKIPFIFGKVYKLANGTPIAFYQDEIQIGMDLYSYEDLSNINFINGLMEDTKKTIIDIYAYGNKITIKI